MIESALSMIVHCKTSFKVWDALKKTFASHSKARALQMKMKILDFALKILVLLNYFLSLEIQQNKDGLHISQKKHVYDLLKRIGMES